MSLGVSAEQEELRASVRRRVGESSAYGFVRVIA